jgi:glycine oxidase
MGNHPDVLILGGGVIGLSAAYFLSRTGLRVAVADRSDFGREASWAGAGIIPPGNPANARTPIDRLRAESYAMFPAVSADLREHTGIDNGYRRCGGIELVSPADRYALGLWDAEGIRYETLSPESLASVEPHVRTPAGTTPFLLPDTAQVRNPWHLRALLAQAELTGADLRPHTPVVGFDTDGNRVLAARTADGGRIIAGQFVVCGGARSDQLLAPLGIQPGVHPVRGQIVLLRTREPVVSRILMVGKAYLVPRGDGRVLVGSTEEPEAGFDKRTTAEAVAKLIALATELVPSLAGAEVEACWAGLRPGTPDGLPYLGPVPGWRNVLVAAGHFRAGIQLSLATGRVVAELVQGQPPFVPVEAFRLDRTPTSPTRPAFRS